MDNVENISNKLINYEPININEPDYDGWKDRITFINTAFSDMAETAFDLILPQIPDYNKTLLSYEFCENPNWEPPSGFDSYYPSYPANYLNNQWAEGNIFSCYMGHGGFWKLFPDEAPGYSWSYPIHLDNPDDTQYDNRIPFILSISCGTANFHKVDDGFVEEIITHNEIRGGIGIIASSVSTYSLAYKSFAPHCFNAFSKDLSMCGEIFLEAKLHSNYRGFSLFGDPALNIKLDSEEIDECDLICTTQQLSTEIIDNQTMKITVGILNRSRINVDENITVECDLLDTTSNIEQSSSSSVYRLGMMETKNVSFYFNIANSMPTDFEIKISVDSQVQISV